MRTSAARAMFDVHREHPSLMLNRMKELTLFVVLTAVPKRRCRARQDCASMIVSFFVTHTLNVSIDEEDATTLELRWREAPVPMSSRLMSTTKSQHHLDFGARCHRIGAHWERIPESRQDSRSAWMSYTLQEQTAMPTANT
jgi:hypothetical protein